MAILAAIFGWCDGVDGRASRKGLMAMERGRRPPQDDGPNNTEPFIDVLGRVSYSLGGGWLVAADNLAAMVGGSEKCSSRLCCDPWLSLDGLLAKNGVRRSCAYRWKAKIKLFLLVSLN